jgi:hypothetical protein
MRGETEGKRSKTEWMKQTTDGNQEQMNSYKGQLKEFRRANEGMRGETEVM